RSVSAVDRNGSTASLQLRTRCAELHGGRMLSGFMRGLQVRAFLQIVGDLLFNIRSMFVAGRFVRIRERSISVHRNTSTWMTRVRRIPLPSASPPFRRYGNLSLRWKSHA